MNPFSKTRGELRRELEAPPALRRFGSGWISGVLGLVLGVAGLLLVLSLRAPGMFAVPELRAWHVNAWFRLVLHVLLLGAFGLSLLSLVLRPQKLLGTCGAAVTVLATLLGGSRSTALVADPAPLFLGLDFFVLNVLFSGLLFIPIERLFPNRPEQGIFRDEWREDLFYLSSTFIHANVGWRFPFLEKWLVTPRFHHWHHGIEDEAVDVNFAIHFPLFDRIFGTHFLPPDRWPSGYGVQGHPVPKGYWSQLCHPFRSGK